MTREQYIVKNCPAIFYSGIIDEAKCWQKWEQFDESCQNCTDCVIKQVIDRCKDSKLSYSNLEILRTACETNQACGKSVMAEQILQLFDIEEVTE